MACLSNRGEAQAGVTALFCFWSVLKDSPEMPSHFSLDIPFQVSYTPVRVR